MNFSKKQNEFCDIPGFDASRGERIAKALQKLWEKIQYLEQSRTSEKKSGSGASCNSKDEELTLTDVQYKLLLLQLQYVRSLLRKKFDSNSEVFHSKISEDDQKCSLPTSDKNNAKEDELHQVIVNKHPSADIETTSNPVDELNPAKDTGSLDNKHKSAQVTSDSQFPRFIHSTENSSAVCQKMVSSSSKPHYHLKLDDVPFILGASSTASHSLVANVQNIIAMMKSHNKALCGPKPNITRSTIANAHSTNFTEKNSTVESSPDVTKMLNELSRDLSALAAKQQKLVESIDAAQSKKPDPEINSAGNCQNQKNKISYKLVESANPRKHRSNSEPEVKLHAEVKKLPKIREKNSAKQSIHPEQSTYNVRHQPSNLSIIDRRKLLRSLQNFKKHLSEEDISWD